MTQQRPVEYTPDGPVIRSGVRGGARTRNFVFLLVPGFSLMTLAAAMEPLRALNRLARFQAYDWRLASLNGEPILTSSGIPLPARNVKEALAEADYLIVCAGFLQESDEQRYLGAIREGASRGITVGALSTGTRLLARAGILTGYRCTTHWETLHTFRDSFPELDCTNKLYVIDRDRLTSSGGTAGLDMMLHLIAEHHGLELGQGVANQLLHERIRNEQVDQPGGVQQDFANLPDTVRRAVRIMRDNIEEPVPVSAIARKVGIGHRQLERLFRKHAGLSPIRFYLRIRIERGRELLIYTRRRIADVAEACGFSTTAHFAASYRRIVGSGPSDARAEEDLLRIAGTILRAH